MTTTKSSDILSVQRIKDNKINVHECIPNVLCIGEDFYK